MQLWREDAKLYVTIKIKIMHLLNAICNVNRLKIKVIKL